MIILLLLSSQHEHLLSGLFMADEKVIRKVQSNFKHD